MIKLFFLFSLAMYILLCGIIMEWMVIFFMFVSSSGVLFAYMKCVKTAHNLTIFWQTLLVMDAFGLFICVIMILVNLIDNEQKRGINAKEKKAGATKSFKKVKHRNYASMADTDVLIENIIIV